MRRRPPRPRRPFPSARQNRGRLVVEEMESRQLLATITVTNPGDTIAVGDGVTLREAITAANTNVPSGDAPAGDTGLDLIGFNIAGGGQQSINVGIATLSPLPQITEQVTIDGTTQPGFVGQPLIELVGTNAGSTAAGLLISASGSTVRGLAINRFGAEGINLLAGGGSLIEGNFLGTDPTGSIDLGNGGAGVTVDGSNANTIGGATTATRNVISGNATQGIILLNGATGNLVRNNFVGTNAAGGAALGNSLQGVFLASNSNATTIVGNLIAANAGGIVIFNPSTGNVVQSNLIGTDVTGTLATDSLGNTFGNSAFGIALSGPNNTIGGLTGTPGTGLGNLISNNQGDGIQLNGATATGNVVLGNLIGTNLAGTAALGNTGEGVFISGPSNLVGGTAAGSRNVISGNGIDGVVISGGAAASNVVQGNFIGTDITGNVDLGNVEDGVYIVDSSNNLVGGTGSGAGNLISGNQLNGVGIEAIVGVATSNVVQGNIIGLNAAGTADLGNSQIGVGLLNAASNTIGGSASGAGNLISGNDQFGVGLSGALTTGNLVQGNRIGTDAAGTAAIGNGSIGVGLTNAPANTIGGTAVGARNVISGNGQLGIGLTGSGASGNVIQANFIGADASGTVDLGNGVFGIGLFDAPNNTIGGSVAAANLIFGNDGGGVGLQGTGATGNVILSNSILANVGLGIDLSPLGPTPNDVNDPDTGPNNLQNFPVLTGFGGGAVSGTLNSTPNTSFTIQIFANAERDPSGFGEGQTLIGQVNVTTDPAGNATFTTDVSPPPGQGFVTATATGPDGTSEFSALLQTVFIVTNTNASGEGSLFQVITDANNTPGTQTITFNIPGSGVQVIALSALPTITDPVVIDATTQPGFAGTPIVQLDGSQTSLVITAGNSVVRGLSITRGVSDGITLQGGGNNTIVGNYIGVDPDGVTAGPTIRSSGIRIENSAGNTIGGTTAADRNVLTGININNNGSQAGVFVTGASSSGNRVTGNYIGTNAAGTAALPNNGSFIGVTIDGAPNTTIGGSAAGAGNVISGNGFGIFVMGAGATGTLIQGNLIGLNASGDAAVPNGAGIATDNFAPTAAITVGGTTAAARNVISGNVGAGIQLNTGTDGSVIQGNYIGTDATGAAAIGNGSEGIDVGSNNNTIGGATAGAGNVISGNGVDVFGDGISLVFNADGNLIAGNFIGTNAAGTAALGNGGSGVLIQSGADNNTVGGITAAARNVISGNGLAGISVDGVDGIQILGNFVGTNAAGTATLANGGNGIEIGRAGLTNNAVVGGTAAGAGNLISGNQGDGLHLGATGAVVQGNRIGTDVTGASPLGNLVSGVRVRGVGATIGGTAVGAGNIIAFNTGDGVQVSENSGAVNNAILSNSIFSNSGLGINLGTDGVTLNDSGDADGGDNNLQNFPDITGLVAGTITGTLASAPNTIYRVQVFSNSSADPSGFGEGQTFLGEMTVTTDPLGIASFAVPVSPPPGQNVFTATATDPAGNTSEFSLAFQLTTGFVVRNTNDSGPDSLRDIISLANATPGLDTITFAIPGIGVQTITLASALPAITDPVVIDAYTQPGASPNTLANGGNAVILVQIDGSGAGGGQSGIVIVSGGSTVRGLSIVGFDGAGILLQSGGGNKVEGNFLGLNAAGNTAIGNGTGVFLLDSSNNVIGGPAPAQRNVISGNVVRPNFNGAGVSINASAGNVAAGNLVQGNYIGTDHTGTIDLGNALHGVFLNGASNNLIGGTTPGAGNVISGNGAAGSIVAGLFAQGGATGNVIQGNLIGTDATGTADLGNAFFGVAISLTPGNTIGGTTAAARNVISGNDAGGIVVDQASSAGTVIQGNFIGTDITGTAALGNGGAGVLLISTTGLTVGGTTPGAGNVISGNTGDGVRIAFADATNNVVLGNVIGTDAAGTIDLGNAINGVLVEGANNTIGGTTAAARNLISGNDGSGVRIDGVNAAGNFVLGNFLGIDVTGTADLGNGNNGVLIAGGATNNTVGGTTAGARNVISGNFIGVRIGFATTGNVVLGNFIGTDVTGTADLGNDDDAVFITNGAQGNTIGGTTAAARNILSGNNGDGLEIDGSGGVGTAGNVVQGNYIGTDVTGTQALGNSFNGVRVPFSSNNTIGGSVPGAGNLISGNSGVGLELFDTSATGNVVQGNFIGTNFDGNAALGNAAAGVLVRNGASNNTIGGTTALARNVISANNGIGIQIVDATTTGNLVQGNFVGTNAAGTAALGNATEGVAILGGASGNTVGGAVLGAGNVISGNNRGVIVSGVGTTGNLIAGNLIGTDVTGTVAIGNLRGGVEIRDGASNNLVGGTAAGDRNVISGNNGFGVAIDQVSSATRVEGNFIGTDSTGMLAIGNLVGVAVSGRDDIVGGLVAGSGNVISGNIGVGVDVGGAAVGTLILGNRIGTNATGTQGLGNRMDGIVVSGKNITIGGSLPAARNVIASNGTFDIPNGPGSGVLIEPPATAVVVRGNFIGTDAAGLLDLGNGRGGVSISRSAGHVVGGTGAGEGNLISGNQFAGVFIQGDGATDNQVQGNRLGTDAAGTGALGNTAGVEIRDGASGNTVGGTTPGAANVISGNGNGIILVNTTGNLIQGNFLGTTAGGLAPLPNQARGILISGASNNMIGGTATGAENVIAFNASTGISVLGSMLLPGVNNTILGNTIFANGGLGIDLNEDGPTPNDLGDTDAGPNGLQNAPVLSGVETTGGFTVVGGLDSTPNTTFRIEFFANTAVDASGFGEGQVFLGSLDVTTDSFGDAFFNASNLIPAAAGLFVTATATSPVDGTSEFSRNVFVRAFRTATIDSTGPITRITVGGDGSSQVNRVPFRNGQFFPSTSAPADSGFFVRQADGTVVGLDLPNHAITAAGATRSVGFNNLALVRSDDGLSITSVMDNAGDQNTLGNRFQVTQVTSYRPGDDFYSVVNTLVNQGDAPLVIDVFAAADLFLADSDEGVGFRVAAVGAVGGTDATGQFNIFIQPAAGGLVPTNFQESRFDLIWEAIGGGGHFNNTIDPNLVDNGAGLEWQSVTVAPGASVTFAYLWAFRLSPPPPQGFTVLNTNDSGPGSLRQAILNANQAEGVQTIDFAIPGVGPFVIALTSDPLPLVRDPVVIDATTQPGFAGAPIVELVGAGLGADANGLIIVAGRSAVRGLRIERFAGNGLVLAERGGNLVEGNVLGDDRLGLGNRDAGLLIVNSPSNVIGGTTAAARNVLSGNGSTGLTILGPEATGNFVLGNFFGPNAAGTAAPPRTQLDGVFIFNAPGNIIGGFTPAERNVISGNEEVGLQIFGPLATGNIIVGNFIGLNAAGTAALPNRIDGLYINDASNNIVVANVISGNRSAGLQIFGRNARNNIAQLNLIGTDATGTRAIPNGFGVFINGSTGNQVDRTGPGRNVIFGNVSSDFFEITAGTAPAVVASRRVIQAGVVIAIELNFNRDMNPTRAQNLANYRLRSSGPDGRFGTRDDGAVAIRSAVYDPTLRTVTLSFARDLFERERLVLTVNGSRRNPITDAAGVRLDGNRDGRPGGDFVARFGFPTRQARTAAVRSAGPAAAVDVALDSRDLRPARRTLARRGARTRA